MAASFIKTIPIMRTVRSVITGIALGCMKNGQHWAFYNNGTNQPSTACLICAELGFPGQLQNMSLHSIINALSPSCLFVEN